MPGGSTCWNGDRRSPHAKFFDIDWDAARPDSRRVLLPILGRSYGEALESGEIELRYDAAEGSFSAWYFEHRLPIGPNRYGEILQKVVARRRSQPMSRPDAACWRLRARYRGPRNPPPRRGARNSSAQIAAVAGGADVIERGLTAYRPTSGRARRGARAASSAGAAALPRSPYWRLARQRDQLSPLLRHQHARRDAGRGCPTSSRRFIRWSLRLIARRTRCKACGSITSTACAIRTNICAACSS